MNLSRIDHVAITVKELRRSADWYEKVLGLGMVNKWKTTWMVGNDLMRMGLFLASDGERVAGLEKKIAIQHFAFRTDALGFIAAQAQLKELEIEYEGPEDSGIAYSIFVYDPDGHQVEITTYYRRVPGESS